MRVFSFVVALVIIPFVASVAVGQGTEGSIDNVRALELDQPDKVLSVKLIQIEQLSPFGDLVDITDSHLFSVKKTLSESSNSAHQHLQFHSHRKTEEMKPGFHYLATYKVEYSSRPSIEVKDLVSIAYDLQHANSSAQKSQTTKPLLSQQFNSFSQSDFTNRHHFLLWKHAKTKISSLNFRNLSNLPLNQNTVLSIYDAEDHLTHQWTIKNSKELQSFEITDFPDGLSEIIVSSESGISRSYALEILGSSDSNSIIEDDKEFTHKNLVFGLACRKANTSQRIPVDQGNKKKQKFLTRCLEQTDSDKWCKQIIRPNPSSKSKFRCTYGDQQVHQLIHPKESTWKFAIEAVKIINELAAKGISTCRINNWWRPEPYNKNVGGSATRHPFGTSIDVHLCSKSEQIKAFKELCKLRRKGRVRAIGFYSSQVLHFGIGDHRGNTWGRSCP